MSSLTVGKRVPASVKALATPEARRSALESGRRAVPVHVLGWGPMLMAWVFGWCRIRGEKVDFRGGDNARVFRAFRHRDAVYYFRPFAPRFLRDGPVRWSPGEVRVGMRRLSLDAQLLFLHEFLWHVQRGKTSHGAGGLGAATMFARNRTVSRKDVARYWDEFDLDVVVA